jgi:hypothetical protein
VPAGRDRHRRRRQTSRLGDRPDGVEIDRRRHRIGQRLEPRLEIGGLAGLDEPEMALGQDQAGLARQRAEHGQADLFHACATSRRCRSLATLLRITPAMVMRGS